MNREKLLNKEAAARLSRYLTEYADTKGVYMKINYVNADHVHVLLDLPTSLSIEELIQLLKGNSSHWINANNSWVFPAGPKELHYYYRTD